MQIFAQEIKDGLAEKLTQSNSLAFDLQLGNLNVCKASEYDGVPSLEDVQQNIDLLYFNSVLASVGWNKNDDVFDRKELWSARNTPVNKKINYMHNEKDIIGHMTKSNVIDFNGRFIPDNVTDESFPSNFDVVVGGYLYKHWQDGELRERMDDIIDKVNNQKLAVSMECLFPHFDYAVQSLDGKQQNIIERNDATAFLTKHLRIYGGNGNYEGFKVGRLLRNMVFTGNALVDNPANPRSLILKSDSINFSGSSATIHIFNNSEHEICQILPKNSMMRLLSDVRWQKPPQKRLFVKKWIV
jgi:hypothetical protein